MRRSTVLVVDDQPAILEVLGVMLGNWGYDTHLVANGVEAKATVEKYDRDIVVSDVRMPEFSGIDLLRVLKSGKPSRPIILMTAHGSVDLAVEAMKQGAQDFLTKPVDYTKLKANLKVAEAEIELRRTSKKLSSQLER